jgi:hypothetical protein
MGTGSRRLVAGLSKASSEGGRYAARRSTDLGTRDEVGLACCPMGTVQPVPVGRSSAVVESLVGPGFPWPCLLARRRGSRRSPRSATRKVMPQFANARQMVQ